MDDIGEILWRASFVILLGIRVLRTSWIIGANARERYALLCWVVRDLKMKGIVEDDQVFVQWT